MDSTVSIITKSAMETVALGAFIGEQAVENLFLALVGDLGAGKTHFVKGLAQGLGITDIVTSPTFTLMNIYDGRLPLKHFDFYRLEREEELYNIGWEEYSNGGVTVVEWAELFPRLIPFDSVRIHIHKVDMNTRKTRISWGIHAPENVVKEIMKYASRP